MPFNPRYWDSSLRGLESAPDKQDNPFNPLYWDSSHHENDLVRLKHILSIPSTGIPNRKGNSSICQDSLSIPSTGIQGVEEHGKPHGENPFNPLYWDSRLF